MAQQTILPFQFQRRFILVHWLAALDLKLITGYWNHTTGSWVETPEEATLFDTKAGAIVYRRGNTERMQQAIERAA